MKTEIQQQEQQRQHWEQQQWKDQTEDEEFSDSTTDDRSTEQASTPISIIKSSATTCIRPDIPIIENTTTVEVEEEFPIPPGMFNIDDEFTNSNTIEKEEEDEKNNNYYDNIDNEIFRNEESTIVFEGNSLAPTTVRTDNPNNIIIEDFLTTKRFDIIVGLLNEDTLDFVIGILSDNPSADHREVVRGILMEALLSQNEVVVDGAGVCDSLFALLDMDKHDDNHIPGRSDHLLFTAAQQVVPIRYLIKITEPTTMDKLLDAEQNELLKQGISNFPKLPKHIQEYLCRQQLKRKQHMEDIQVVNILYYRKEILTYFY